MVSIPYPNWLVVDLPLWKMELKSVGMVLPNIWKVIKFMFQTTNQYRWAASLEYQLDWMCQSLNIPKENGKNHRDRPNEERCRPIIEPCKMGVSQAAPERLVLANHASTPELTMQELKHVGKWHFHPVPSVLHWVTYPSRGMSHTTTTGFCRGATSDGVSA